MTAAAEISDNRMSFAQKEWPRGGRIPMAGINSVNTESVPSKLLDGHVALVTGGSRGIGRAIAHRLATLGASVAICGRDPAALEDSSKSLQKLGARVFSQVADVIHAAQVSELVAETESRLGPIQIL